MAGVGFAIKTCHLRLLESLPQGINERLMVLRLHLASGYVTMISAYAPTMTHTDETKEQFYEELDRVIQATPHSDKLLILGDFNARVGKDHSSWERIVGHHGVGKENSNGSLLLSACAQHQLAITNTMFQLRNAHKTTWMHPRSKHWHQIDFIIVRQKDIGEVHVTRAMKGSVCLSDHSLIRAKIAFCFKPPRLRVRSTPRKKIDVAKLKNPEVSTQLREQTAESLRAVGHENLCAEDLWKKLSSAIIEPATETLGYVKRKHRDWFDENNEEVKSLLDDLHLHHLQYVNDKASATKKDAYLHLKRQSQAALRSMKDKWWKDRATDLQNAADRKDSKAFYAGLRTVYGPSSKGSTPLFATDGETLLKNPDAILSRWVEHFEDVLNRVSVISDEAINQLPQSPIHDCLDNQPCLEETTLAIKQLSTGKAAGPDGIPAEVLKNGGEVIASHLTELFCRIWAEEAVPQDFKDALIVHIYKNKGNRRVCDNHRGISLLSIVGKTLARIIVNRLTKTVADQVIPESQCGFRSSRGTVDMLFSARQVQEKCREQNMDLYMVFVDLTKAFDSVGREGLWKILSKAGCPPRITNIIRSFHEGMAGRVIGDNSTSESFAVTNGTKQGCVMAPLLFSIVFSAVLHDAFHDCDKGVMIRFRSDGSIFNLQRLKAKTKTSCMLLRDLLYADDCALIAHSEEDAQSIVDLFSQATIKYGLTISIRKTEVLYQPKPGKTPYNPTITVADEPLKSVDKFCYLGGILSQNAKIDDEITSRISKASSSYGRLQQRLWSERGIKLSTKIQVYQAVVLSTLLYGCETWTQYRAHVKKLEQFHMRSLRRICGISWRDRIPNTDVLKRCNIGSIESVITRAQLRWSGHVARMGNERIPKALLFGQLDKGKRSTGGQRKRFKDVLKATMKTHDINWTTWEGAAMDRVNWRKLCHEGSERFEAQRTANLIAKRERRHAAQLRPINIAPLTTAPTNVFICPDCQRQCASRIGLHSHRRHHHRIT